jgi:uncharacterized protein (TIGR02598 family)
MITRAQYKNSGRAKFKPFRGPLGSRKTPLSCATKSQSESVCACSPLPLGEGQGEGSLHHGEGTLHQSKSALPKTSNRSARSRSSAGFTLVEVALAVGITAFGIVAILGLFANGLQSSRAVANNTIAAAIGQNLINQFQSQSAVIPPNYYYARLAYCGSSLLQLKTTALNDPKDCYYDADGNPLGNSTSSDGGFQATYRIDSTSVAVTPLFKITVTVGWPTTTATATTHAPTLNTITNSTLVSFP